MTKDYPQLWKNVTSSRDEDKAVRILAEILVDREGRSFVGTLKRADAELCVEILDHGITEHNLKAAEKRAFFLALRRLAGMHGQLPESLMITDKIEVSDNILASGGYADVRTGTYLGALVAVKTVRVEEQDGFMKIRKQFCKEVILWNALSHPNVLKLVGVYGDMNKGEFITISEWMAHGNVMQYITNNHVNRLELLHGAAEGLKYLHGANLVHGDLKGANILMSNDTPPRACLADFRSMTMVLDPSHRLSRSAKLEGGTTMFMAPELLVPSKFGFMDSVPTQKSDIYAFGLVIYQVLMGEVPFSDLRMGEIAMSIAMGKRPTKPKNASDLGLSNSLWDFARRCWDGTLALRPGIAEVVSQLGKASAAWNGVMVPRVLVEDVVPETPEPESDSMEHRNIFVSSGQVDLQSPTDGTSPRSTSVQCSESSLAEFEKDVEEPPESPIEPPEEPLEVVETRPKPAIEKFFAPFVVPEPVPRVRTLRREEPYDDPPGAYPRPRPNEYYELLRSQLLPMERRSDDVSLMEEAEEDFVLVFPHINKNQNPPPSNQQGSTVSGRLSSLLVSMFKTPLGLAQIVTEPQRRPGQDLTDRVDQDTINGVHQLNSRLKELGGSETTSSSNPSGRKPIANQVISLRNAGASAPLKPVMQEVITGPNGETRVVPPLPPTPPSPSIVSPTPATHFDRLSLRTPGMTMMSSISDALSMVTAPSPSSSSSSESQRYLTAADELERLYIVGISEKDFALPHNTPDDAPQPSQELINELDQGEDGDVSFEDQPEAINTLGKMCRHLNTIPDSVHIETCQVDPTSEGYNGGFANVYQGVYRGRKVAVKTLRLYITSNFEECFGKFRREVIAWRHLRHPHILPLIGVILERHRLAMVSEWMDHGNINEFIKNHDGVNRAQLLVDAANGLEYMHNINIVHGDLKGANILVNQRSRACLADFGLSTIVGTGFHALDNASMTSVVSKTSLVSFTAGGTTRWMSPELLDPDLFGTGDRRPTKQSDCYALGMVIYEVLCGNAPFWEIRNEAAVTIAITEGRRPQRPEGAGGRGFTEGLWRVVQNCWHAEASERPDVKNLLFQLGHAAWSWDRERAV